MTNGHVHLGLITDGAPLHPGPPVCIPPFPIGGCKRASGYLGGDPPPMIHVVGGLQLTQYGVEGTEIPAGWKYVGGL